jgi:Na+-translocating ferredoxin:NAD+ oxidoreductase RnfG subunit
MRRFARPAVSPPSSRRPGGGAGRRIGLALVLALLAVAGPAVAKVYLSVDEAVRLTFPGCEVAHHTAYLTPEQQKRARELSGEPVPSALVSYYTATRGGQPAGIAYFDTHLVRTQPETLMIAVDPQGKVTRIEVISFREPEEYMPKGVWYEQFLGKGLTRDLALKRSIRPVTGATLTARATTSAVRRVLALHQVIAEGAKPAG